MSTTAPGQGAAYAVGTKQGAQAGAGWRLKPVMLVMVSLFLASCIFDPADLLFRLKVPLFCTCWLVFSLFLLPRIRSYKIPLGLLTYVGAMIAIPMFSVMYYQLTNGSQPYEGFALLKAYLMMSFSILLFLSRIDALIVLCRLLSVLAVAIISLYIAMKSAPALFARADAFLNRYGIANVNTRDYSDEVSLLLVFFVTSPMLVLPIAHYTHRAITERGWGRLSYAVSAAINILGMFLAGTRANLLTAILLPAAIIVMRVRRKAVIFVCAAVALAAVIFAYRDQLAVLFSAEEYSNQHKLTLLRDYWSVLSEPKTLLLGQGLGAYQYWTPRGHAFPVTELTYLDVIRFYGVILGAVVIWLMVYPVVYAFVINPRFAQRHIIVGYAFYLAACFGQPLFFSSSGMSLLSVILANIYIHTHRRLQFR